jgi:hypothetical protein
MIVSLDMKRASVWWSRLAGAAGVVLAGCAPAAVTTPLGLGPLAVAEQNAERSAPTKTEKAAPEPNGEAPALAAVEVVAKADKDKEASEPASSEPKDEGEPASGEASKTPAFEGLFAGDDVAVFRLAGSPEREQKDDKAKIRIEKATPGNVSITLINSEDGSDLCELLARVDGNAALIESAQPCFSDGGEGSLEALLTSGRAVVTGDELRMNAEGTLSLALPDQELDGELTYTFKGKRE